MAQIDSSIYFNQQPFDPAGSVQKGLQMADFINQRQRQRVSQDKEDAINKAYKSSMTVGPDGKFTLDTNKFNASVGQIAPEKLPGLQQQQAEQKLSQDKVTAETLKNKAGYFFQNFQNIKDQSDLDARVQKAISEGHPEAQTLPVFDPKVYSQKVEEAKLAALDPNQFLSDQRSRETHQDSMADRGVRREQMRNDKQIAELDKVGSRLEQMRGSPAAAQAEKDIYAAQKVNSLVNLYGDPNKLDPQQVQLVASEVAKIAQGGVPSIHELQGLNPNTIPKSLASLAQTFTNAPVKANQGAFLKAMKDYTDSLTKDAKEVINDRYGRILKPYESMYKDHPVYKGFQDQYLNRFKEAGQVPGSYEHMSDDELHQEYIKAGGK